MSDLLQRLLEEHVGGGILADASASDEGIEPLGGSASAALPRMTGTSTAPTRPVTPNEDDRMQESVGSCVVNCESLVTWSEFVPSSRS